MRIVIFCLIAFQTFFSCTSDNFWKYLEQKPPGIKPQIFAPGIISGKGRIHCFPSFSTDGKEIFWMELPPKILCVKYENGKWSVPKVPDFAKDFYCIRPIHSYDDSRIYFASNLSDGYGSMDICFVERLDTGFSKVKIVPEPLNSQHFEAQATFTKDGTAYFS